MNILFVFSLDDILGPDKPLRNQDQIQYGVSYISGLLKKHGHNTRLVVFSEVMGRKYKGRISKAIDSFRPQLICYTAVATEFDFVKKIAEFTKNEYPRIFQIIGGAHVTLRPNDAISGDAFDAICVGEGEYPTLELVEQLSKNNQASGIKNLWIRKKSRWEKIKRLYFLKRNLIKL